MNEAQKSVFNEQRFRWADSPSTQDDCLRDGCLCPTLPPPVLSIRNIRNVAQWVTLLNWNPRELARTKANYLDMKHGNNNNNASKHQMRINKIIVLAGIALCSPFAPTPSRKEILLKKYFLPFVSRLSSARLCNHHKWVERRSHRDIS